MSIPLQCTRCRARFRSTIFSGSGTLIIENSSEACPYCGSMTNIPDGQYQIVNDFLKAFFADGRDLNQAKILSTLIEMKISGNSSSDEIRNIEESLSGNIQKFWNSFNKNSSGLALLLTILMLFIPLYQWEEAQIDAVKNQAISDRQYQIESQILQELQKQSAFSSSQQVRNLPKKSSRMPSLKKTPGTAIPSRHERRKSAKSLAKKNKVSRPSPPIQSNVVKGTKMKFENATFEAGIIQVDGNSYIGCTFKKGVVFEYGGGPLEISGCNFDEMPGFALTGDFARGLEVLRKLHHMAGPSAVKSMVDSISSMLRKSSSLTNPTIN